MRNVNVSLLPWEDYALEESSIWTIIPVREPSVYLDYPGNFDSLNAHQDIATVSGGRGKVSISEGTICTPPGSAIAGSINSLRSC